MKTLNRWEVWELITRLGTTPKPDAIHPFDKKCLKLYESGLSLKTIANQVGVSEWTVRNRLKKFNVLRTSSEGNILKLDEREIIRLYQSGMSARAIGDKYGISAQPIKDRLKKAGISIRPSSEYNVERRPTIDTEKCIKLYESGLSLHQVARQMGCSETGVRNTLIKAGIERRSVKKKT